MRAHATHSARCLVLVALAMLSGLPCAFAQSGEAPPRGPRVIHAPTAWIQASGSVFATAGANQRGGGFGAISVGLGGLAEVGLVSSDRAVVCDGCRADDATPGVEHLFETSAVFRVGLGNGVVWRGPLALAVGFRRTFAAREAAEIHADLGELYAVGSYSAGTLDLHAGARLHGARAERASGESNELLGAGAFAGLQWRPSRYPRTTMMADFSFAPEFSSSDVDLRWLVGWGVRYQALSFGSIELGARHRQGEGFDDAAVLIRLNGRFP